MRALVVVALLLVAARAGAEKIVGIRVYGNVKTTPSTVRLLAAVSIGDELTPELVERVKSDLESSGLFQTVEVRSAAAPGGVRLIIHTVDKQSWIVAPTVLVFPGNIGGGVGFIESNLAGLDKKLVVYGQLATADSFVLVGYLDPAIHDSRWYLRLDSIARHHDATEYDAADHAERTSTMMYYNLGVMFGANLWHGWSLDSRLRVAHVGYSDPHWEDGYDAPGRPAPPLPDADGWDIADEWRLTRDGRSSWNGVTSGVLLQLLLERSLPFLGSAFDYTDAQLKLGFYLKLWRTHNLVFRPSLAAGTGLPFDQEFVAGGTSLRGFAIDQFRGDLRVAAQLEYSLELFWVKSLAFRALAFWDTAYTALVEHDGATRSYLPEELGSGRERWRNGVGAGFRVYVRSIVLPLVGIDVGYGVELRDVNVYFALGVTEL